jgi:hypothetical protein
MKASVVVVMFRTLDCDATFRCAQLTKGPPKRRTRAVVERNVSPSPRDRGATFRPRCANADAQSRTEFQNKEERKSRNSNWRWDRYAASFFAALSNGNGGFLPPPHDPNQHLKSCSCSKRYTKGCARAKNGRKKCRSSNE